jgi:hypothetical protein
MCSCHLGPASATGSIVRDYCIKTLLSARDDDQKEFGQLLKDVAALGDEVILGVFMGWPIGQEALMRRVSNVEPVIVFDTGDEIVDYRDLPDDEENRITRAIGSFNEAVIDRNYDRINRLFREVTSWDYNDSMSFAWSLCYGASFNIDRLSRIEPELHRGHGCPLDPDKED